MIVDRVAWNIMSTTTTTLKQAQPPPPPLAPQPQSQATSQQQQTSQPTSQSAPQSTRLNMHHHHHHHHHLHMQHYCICSKFVPQAFNTNKCQQCFNFKEVHSQEALAEFSKVRIVSSYPEYSPLWSWLSKRSKSSKSIRRRREKFLPFWY